MEINNLKILVRGAGDLASGIIWNLAYAGFNVCCTDIEKPSCIRTEVAFSSAIYERSKTLDDVTCVFCESKEGLQSVVQSIYKCWEENKVALIIDPEAKILDEIKFDVVIDAILAKKNLGTSIDMAPLVIGVGPGFTANKDCNFVIETVRGHNLSRIIENGSALENTGIPGIINGHGADRVMHSPTEGIFHNVHKIGDSVTKGEILSEIEECVNGKANGNKVNLIASIDGVLRGILKDGYYATKGLKAADIDPRISEKENCFTISDKARSIGGAVIVTIMHNLCERI